ncbi:MAG: diaminopimelate decarboxylase [Thaumarchaeota archaeon]|nr:diaminopimelate decarboxylase [Nitrososphaerota archaeon]
MQVIEPPLEVRDKILRVGGVSTLELAQKFGTPLFVTDENRIRENYKRIVGAFTTAYRKFSLQYALKANNNLSILRILRSMDSGADCSCIEEITLAKKAGYPSNRIIYTGNFNSDIELKLALKEGVMINLDDVAQLPRLRQFGKPEILSFRINPGVGKGRYAGLVFGGRRTKFGIEEKKAVKGYLSAKRSGIRHFGIHVMSGSAILEKKYFPKVAERLLNIAGRIAKKVGIEFEFINIGGGFGIPYKPSEKALDIEFIGKEVGELFTKLPSELSLGTPTLMIEPGRYIVGDTTILLAKVHGKKKGTVTTYVGTDAGMNTLLRPALYGAYHQVYVANRMFHRPNPEKITICGQICENTDVIAEGRRLPLIKEGDILAILNAGAYGFAMSSQYNNRPRAAEVLVNGGTVDLIRERETVSDLTLHQKIPERLKN